MNTTDLLATLATPRPRHIIATVYKGGYIYSDCTCGAYRESKGNDESSRNATAWWALEHQKEDSK